MSENVERALQALQAAHAAAELYSAEHSAVRAHEERAATELAEALRDTESISIVLLESRVVVADVPLASGPRLLEGFLGRLRKMGVELVAFSRGVDRDELHAFVTQGSGEHAGKRPLRGGRRVKLGFIEGLGGSRHDTANPAAVPPGSWAASCRAIEGAWGDVLAGQLGDASAIGGAVAQICSVAAVGRGSLLPLAMLKRHDEYTFVHTYNVAIMSSALATTIGLNADLVHDITLAAMLHDVGKERVPREILNKGGALSEAELKIMRRHPELGARLLLDSPGVPDIAIAVAYEHHMNLDGSGYPSAPKRWRVGLPSQVVHIADIFDALRTRRPYRPAMALPEAFATLRKGAGVWFDAALLDVFEHRVACRADPIGQDAVPSEPGAQAA